MKERLFSPEKQQHLQFVHILQITFSISLNQAVIERPILSYRYEDTLTWVILEGNYVQPILSFRCEVERRCWGMGEQ